MDISALKVTELREELGKRGLSVKGLKAELAERLEEAVKTAEFVEPPNNAETAENVESPTKKRGRTAATDENIAAKLLKVKEVKKDDKLAETSMIVEMSDTETEQDENIETAESVEDIESVETAENIEITENIQSSKTTETSETNVTFETTETENFDTVTSVEIGSENGTDASFETDETSSKIVHVTHLTRPFSLTEFKSILSPFGEIEDLWLDSLKTQSFVTFSTSESAAKCKSELSGKQFPEQTGKHLSIEFSTEESMKASKSESENISSTAIGTTLINTLSTEGNNVISLEELFKRTQSEPSIYYLPNN